ncbi:putative ABC transport system ATP-binding protein [Pseudidiomarina maritima]|jgi:ABC-type antimicrobial peptide transport system, ATPase component|uniref:Putative ABC transport system ATP-binding protein n=1 Tax=Pseudidiomarina maritima TaxID=519453 RepID=A0A1I6GVS2_9GAMM|nr:ABC transporter ATP-binding protein [Pseudidiomarina maritima]SFR46137.1 putative ABC transport system ATP-binding protein [Pseudidiomarina maritima]
MNKLIELRNITRSFGLNQQVAKVLDSINLTIDDGDKLAIVGPSGSGKSTLLSIIGLLDPHYQGEYLLRGREITTLENKQLSQLRNNQIGWIFQNFNLISHLTALDNVALPMRYNQNIKPKEYKERALHALDIVGLADKYTSKPSELSGGQQQRVAIARALVNEPSLILADEPTGNLDSHTSDKIIELLLNLPTSGATLVIVTHDTNIAQRCDRRIKIHDGSLVNDYQ